MLETAYERYFDVTDEAGACDLIMRSFWQFVQKRRGISQ
jgi:hypothetical protein